MRCKEGSGAPLLIFLLGLTTVTSLVGVSMFSGGRTSAGGLRVLPDHSEAFPLGERSSGGNLGNGGQAHTDPMKKLANQVNKGHNASDYEESSPATEQPEESEKTEFSALPVNKTPSSTPVPLSALQLSDDEWDERLHQFFGPHFRTANLSKYSVRRKGPITPLGDGRVLEDPGNWLAIRGREETVDALVQNLESIFKTYQRGQADPLDRDQLRRRFLFQYAVATPGLGKTTFLMEHPTWLEERHFSSVAPAFAERLRVYYEKRLLFRHDFSKDGPDTLENHLCPNSRTKLASRMLYATLEGSGEWPYYYRFVEACYRLDKDFFKRLLPDHVLRFVWRCAGLEPRTAGLALFSWDEASAAEGFVQPLMSAYLEEVLLPGRSRLPGAPDPYFVAMVLASTRVEVADMQATSSGRAKSKPLPFTLLNQGDVVFIVKDFVQRLGGFVAGDPPIHVQLILNLVEGNHRLVEKALVCMSGGASEEVVIGDGLIEYWKSRGEALADVVGFVRDYAKMGFSKFLEDPNPWAQLRDQTTGGGHRLLGTNRKRQRVTDKAEGWVDVKRRAGDLLQLVHAHSVLDRAVSRRDPLPGEMLDEVTWEHLEMTGMITLLDAGLARTGKPSASMSIAQVDPYVYQVVVRVAPIVIHALQETSGLLSSKVYTSQWQPDFQDKEEGDVGMVVERLRCLKYLGDSVCTLDQLIGPLSRSSPLKDLELVVPSKGFRVRPLRQHVVPGDFDKWIKDLPRGGVWAFRGAGQEHGPDGWVLLETTAGRPFILYLQSKSSKYLGRKRMKAGEVAIEYEKVVTNTTRWPLPLEHVFLVVTDLFMDNKNYNAATTHSHVEVVHSGNHHHFYGSAGSALRSLQALSILHRECPKHAPTPKPPTAVRSASKPAQRTIAKSTKTSSSTKRTRKPTTKAGASADPGRPIRRAGGDADKDSKTGRGRRQVRSRSYQGSLLRIHSSLAVACPFPRVAPSSGHLASLTLGLAEDSPSTSHRTDPPRIARPPLLLRPPNRKEFLRGRAADVRSDVSKLGDTPAQGIRLPGGTGWQGQALLTDVQPRKPPARASFRCRPNAYAPAPTTEAFEKEARNAGRGKRGRARARARTEKELHEARAEVAHVRQGGTGREAAATPRGPDEVTSTCRRGSPCRRSPPLRSSSKWRMGRAKRLRAATAAAAFRAAPAELKPDSGLEWASWRQRSESGARAATSRPRGRLPGGRGRARPTSTNCAQRCARFEHGRTEAAKLHEEKSARALPQIDGQKAATLSPKFIRTTADLSAQSQAATCLKHELRPHQTTGEGAVGATRAGIRGERATHCSRERTNPGERTRLGWGKWNIGKRKTESGKRKAESEKPEAGSAVWRVAPSEADVAFYGEKTALLHQQVATIAQATRNQARQNSCASWAGEAISPKERG
ncbi:hypothetical protein KFL_000620240 [Klebsormidium nitens]|uniref:Uncharacterized protein n=1 Tax=Klebsormidium nitens TaxID=105231 RepID=A0A1Y1HQ92_KLENI|nr:hypothetical protein KFL_000620240 [Klebsormidium nitens]|eukprot:GAQ80790.1 hypothetical protein KFL_000620240 [Klebsormidium nitens]